MSFLRVPLFTLISSYLLLHLGFCKEYQNFLVALTKITTVDKHGFQFELIGQLNPSMYFLNVLFLISNSSMF